MAYVKEGTRHSALRSLLSAVGTARAANAHKCGARALHDGAHVAKVNILASFHFMMYFEREAMKRIHECE